jgi:hypothetical protein
MISRSIQYINFASPPPSIAAPTLSALTYHHTLFSYISASHFSPLTHIIIISLLLSSTAKNRKIRRRGKE